MGWHDNYVHAFGHEEQGDQQPAYDVLLDIDYAVEWVKPLEPGGSLRFWICPATLVFHHILALDVTVFPNVDFLELMRIVDLERSDEQVRSSDGSRDWLWHAGPFSFRAGGFTQYLRTDPFFPTASG